MINITRLLGFYRIVVELLYEPAYSRMGLKEEYMHSFIDMGIKLDPNSKLIIIQTATKLKPRLEFFNMAVLW